MRTMKVCNKKQLKVAIQNCKGTKENTHIILNDKTEYIIYWPVSNWQGEDPIQQVIENINKTSEDAFLPSPKLKGFELCKEQEKYRRKK